MENAMFKFKKLHPDAQPPKKAKKGDAAYDLTSVEDILIPSLFQQTQPYRRWNYTDDDFSHSVKIKTGIALELPEGYVAQICERSGLGSKLLKVCGGVCDPNYRGEYLVSLANLGLTDYFVKRGDRIAQLLIHKVEDGEFVEAELSDTNRGDDGFGSSDLKG